MEIPSQYLNQPIQCACGRTHTVPIRNIVIRESILDSLSTYVKALHPTSVLVVADEYTWEAFGQTVAAGLTTAGVATESFVLTGEGHELHPDERAVESVTQAMSRTNPNLLVAVGSGVVNDVVRFASHQAGLDYIIVGTAPSMDGYASSVAAMQFAGVKTTFPARSPMAIFADVNVLAKAPWALIQSGFGDLLGKVTSLMDWKLAHTLYDEPFCEASYRLVFEPLAYTIEHVDELVHRDTAAVLQLFNGLVSAGISMAMVGNSRPCSGCEHHCSHYWDLLAYQRARPDTSHGLQVGYATHWTIRFYQYLTQLRTLHSPVHEAPSDAWVAYARAFYKDGADEVLRAQRDKYAWLQEHHGAVNGKTMDCVTSALEPEMTLASKAAEALRKMGIPSTPGFLQVDRPMLLQTFRHARELRARYTVFDFLVGQGELENAIDSVLDTSLHNSK